MYIPNAEKWIKYYNDVIKGYTNSFESTRGIRQTGGNISRSSNDFMIPIDQHNQSKDESSPIKKLDVKMVSPTQQIVEQAKSKLELTKKKRLSSNNYSKKKRTRDQSSRRVTHSRTKKRIKRGNTKKQKPRRINKKKGSKKRKTVSKKKARTNIKKNHKTTLPAWLH